MVVEINSRLNKKTAKTGTEKRKEKSKVNSILGGASNLATGHGSRTKKEDMKSNYVNSSSSPM